LINGANERSKMEADEASRRLKQIQEFNDVWRKMLKDQQDGTANAEQQRIQLEKQYNELVNQKEDLKKDYDKRIAAVQDSIATSNGKLITLNGNIKTTNEKLDEEQIRADKAAADVQKRIADTDKTIDQAQTTTDNILKHYGQQAGSDAAVNATLDLLTELLALPKTIVDGSNNYNQFKSKISQLVDNITIGINQIEQGSITFPPFEKSPIGVCYWFKVNFPGNLSLADNAYGAGLDYNYLVDDLTAADIKNDLGVTSLITSKQILKKRDAMKSTGPDHYNPFEMDPNNPPKELNDAKNLVNYGHDRVLNELTFFKQVADSMNEPLQAVSANS